MNLTQEKLPQVLAIQKKKLLLAINKNNDETSVKITPEDEQLVKDVTETSTVAKSCLMAAEMNVKATLNQHAHFQLTKYLNSAEIVCKTFSMKRCIFKSMSSATIDYVLTHARQFGDPTKAIFQIESAANRDTKSNVDSAPSTSQHTTKKLTIATRVNLLIEELRKAYDETKFQTLNAQVTSLTLIIVSRAVKKYRKSMDEKLHFLLADRPSLKNYVTGMHLVIEAYLNTDDERTKKNIRDSCVKYMEWYDMQLPRLFFKVVELYAIDVGQLWDLLCSVDSREVAKSLIDFATNYSSHGYFPYCRILHVLNYKSLSNNENVCICTILSYLVEKKNVVEDPAYMYTCPQDAHNVKDWAKQQADKLYNKIMINNY